MSKIDEICKCLGAKFSSDGKIQSDIKELFIYRASVPTEFLTGVYEPALCIVFKGSKLALSASRYAYPRRCEDQRLPVSSHKDQL